jgi:hypothetical protein
VDFEHGINLCIREIRTALGDDAATPRYVETLPRQGYRFIAPIQEASQEKTLGRYRLTEKIGAGGMGEVYHAQDQHLGRDVAVKVLPPSVFQDENIRNRFRREAKLLCRLNHANIATVYGGATGIHARLTQVWTGEDARRSTIRTNCLLFLTCPFPSELRIADCWSRYRSRSAFLALFPWPSA